MKTLKALVIDDDPETSVVVRHRLAVLEDTCDSAENIEDARRMMRENSYDYILLDLCLPVSANSAPSMSNGIEFLRTFRQDAANDGIEVFIITANGKDDTRLVREMIRLRANGFVYKPFLDDDPPTLEDNIRHGTFRKRFQPEGIVPGSQSEFNGCWLTPGEVLRGSCVWTCRAKDGKVRTWKVRTSSERFALLNLIYQSIGKTNIVEHTDIIRECRFDRKVYFKNGYKRTPMKNPVSLARTTLFIDIEPTEFGFRFAQPDTMPEEEEQK